MQNGADFLRRFKNRTNQMTKSKNRSKTHPIFPTPIADAWKEQGLVGVLKGFQPMITTIVKLCQKPNPGGKDGVELCTDLQNKCKSGLISLDDLCELYPNSKTAKDMKKAQKNSKASSTNPIIPTPTANDFHSPNILDAKNRMTLTLRNYVKLVPENTEHGCLRGGKDNMERQELIKKSMEKTKYPTPKCTGCAGGSGAIEKLNQLERDGIITPDEKRALQNGWNGGKLNPNWEEWLMGWPVGWTSLQPLTSIEYPVAA